ncbi:MEDS domain-containing protein [Streptomyces caatingaensis]|uniref:MEDS domain-containing protein n=1 Tax=Streptomyces caatingaensis TaxID=1678637 RepID=UPI0006727DD9|nr:MEDS domain-containing protein [Streptomyces caatingaensis]
MVPPGGALRPVHAGDLRPGDHVCLPFASDEERTTVLQDVVRGGLDARDKILHLAGPGEPPAPVGESLALEGELEPAALLGRLRRAADRSRAEGFRALRITGGPGAAGPRDVHGLLRYEALLEAELGPGRALAVCLYDVRRAPGALEVCGAAHARRVEADPLVRTPGLLVVRTHRPPGLRLEGVVDAAARRPLRDALRSVADVREDVRLDVSRAEFPDLGGLRLLMGFARARAARHRVVELSGLAPQQARIITLIGWDRTPGLALSGPGRPPQPPPLRGRGAAHRGGEVSRSSGAFPSGAPPRPGRPGRACGQGGA